MKRRREPDFIAHRNRAAANPTGDGRKSTATARTLRLTGRRTIEPPDLGLTLIVHSGPAEEVVALVALAQPPYIVISPWPKVEYYPAVNLYSRARRIITGAGYNSMADLLAHRARHTAVPFPRRYDDQHARVKYFFTRRPMAPRRQSNRYSRYSKRPPRNQSPIPTNNCVRDWFNRTGTSFVPECL